MKKKQRSMRNEDEEKNKKEEDEFVISLFLKDKSMCQVRNRLLTYSLLIIYLFFNAIVVK